MRVEAMVAVDTRPDRHEGEEGEHERPRSHAVADDVRCSFTRCEASRAERIEVCAQTVHGRLVVEVRDDGVRGVPPRGLTGLGDRLRWVHGELEVTSPVGAGSTTAPPTDECARLSPTRSQVALVESPSASHSPLEPLRPTGATLVGRTTGAMPKVESSPTEGQEAKEWMR